MNRRPGAVAGAGAALAAAFLALPLAALVLRTSPGALAGALGSAQMRSALAVSVVTSLGALAVAVALGLPLAWVLARGEFPGRRALRALALAPIALPPVVGGVALLAAYGRRGVAGGALASALGVELPFTTSGAVLAGAFVAMPFFVLAAEAGIRSADRGLEEAAATLGAGAFRRARWVTLPAAAPALGAGAALCWARALGEFGATITFAGNLPGRTQTVPLAIYQALDTDPEGAFALSLVLLAVALATLVAFRGSLPGSRG